LTALAYEIVLHLLLRFFTHTDETDEQLGILIDAAIGMMASVPGNNAGFAFEMFYVMTNAVPWRKPAWTVIHERTSLLATNCATFGAQDAAPQAVRDAADQAAAIAAKLAAHLG
jgi:hypothetical protein